MYILQHSIDVIQTLFNMVIFQPKQAKFKTFIQIKNKSTASLHFNMIVSDLISKIQKLLQI